MCNCKTEGWGDPMTEVVGVPDSVIIRKDKRIQETLEVDSCITKELQELWKLGIATTESCCGHNSELGYIKVELKNIPDMQIMLYGQYIFENDLKRRDTFLPKSVFCVYCDKTLAPCNFLDLFLGEHDCNLYSHDSKVNHPERDLGIFRFGSTDMT